MLSDKAYSLSVNAATHESARTSGERRRETARETNENESEMKAAERKRNRRHAEERHRNETKPRKGCKAKRNERENMNIKRREKRKRRARESATTAKEERSRAGGERRKVRNSLAPVGHTNNSHNNDKSKQNTEKCLAKHKVAHAIAAAADDERERFQFSPTFPLRDETRRAKSEPTNNKMPLPSRAACSVLYTFIHTK